VQSGSALVPAAELVAYVKTLPKPARFGLPPTVVIHPEDGQVRFTCVTHEGEVSRTIRTLDGEFPKYQSLIPTGFTDLPEEGIAMNPKYVADVAKMPVPKNGGVRVQFTGSGRPMVWTPMAPLDSGVQWLYLLMPARIGA
jgi:DNA polymerase III sliding clamp (beta) subunit (PCNA family)